MAQGTLTIRWYVMLTCMTAVLVIATGVSYGYLAVLMVSYWGHFFVAGLSALFFYLAMRMAPDGNPGFCLLLTLVASGAILIMGHLIAFDSYHDAFAGTNLSVINQFAEAGAPYRTREFFRYGAYLTEIRSGSEVYLTWAVQMLTLPLILGYGIVLGGFRAHEKQAAPGIFDSALDQLVEQQAEINSLHKWQALQNNIRGFHPRYLAQDLFHTYTLFLKPLGILFAVIIFFPSTAEAKPLVVFWASLFMMHAAHASLTGTGDSMRMRLGAAFEQFTLFATMVAMLFMALLFGFPLTLLVIGSLTSLIGTDSELGSNLFSYVYPAMTAGLALTALLRLWPMFTMHYLFADVEETANDRSSIAQERITNSMWFGARGPSMILAWNMTAMKGSFIKATIPALFIPMLVLAGYFELQTFVSGPLAVLCQGVFYLLVVPYLYMLLMDRALALRETLMEAETESEISSTDSLTLLDADDQLFLAQTPGMALPPTDQLVLQAEDILNRKILEETSGNPDLLLARAIQYNNQDWFEAALKSGANANTLTESGKTPLGYAARAGQLNFVRQLIDAGADIHGSDEVGNQPIHEAVRYHDTDTLDCLLDAGADVNAKGRWGETPLMRAADNNAAAAARLLLDRGADLHYRVNNNNAMLKAISDRSIEVLTVFLEEDVDMYFTDITVLRKVVMYPKALALFLTAGLDPNFSLGGGATLLCDAAGGAHNESVSVLLAHGADPLIRDDGHRLPVDYAIAWDARLENSYEAIRRQLEQAMRDSEAGSSPK